MSLARDALFTLSAAVDVLRRGPVLPAEPASAGVVTALAAQDAVPAKPQEAVLERLRRDLVALAGEGRGFAVVPMREMRDAAWLLWSTDEPLAALPGLLSELLARARERRSLLRALVEAWIAGYSPGAAMVREAGVALSQLVAEHSHPSFKPWARIHRSMRLFDTPDGPRSLAQSILTGAEPVATHLADVGFDDPLRAVSGYMRAVQGEALALAAERLSSGAGARERDRLFEFLAPNGALRFNDPRAAGQVAHALLSPWFHGASGTSEEARFAIQEFLLAYLGDPRLRPQLWQAAGDEPVALIRAWLTKASLDAFFKLVGDYALDKHWKYRQAFWGAYLKAGVITDARLALAAAIYADARSVKELRGAFGKLQGNGVQGNQSVLLMRIGDLVFSEWSHNGALRAWPAEWKTAPPLMRGVYDRQDFMATSLPFPPNVKGKGGNSRGNGLRHDGSITGHWQGSVAELIARRTRIRLTEHDYMPR